MNSVPGPSRPTLTVSIICKLAQSNDEVCQTDSMRQFVDFLRRQFSEEGIVIEQDVHASRTPSIDWMARVSVNSENSFAMGAFSSVGNQNEGENDAAKKIAKLYNSCQS